MKWEMLRGCFFSFSQQEASSGGLNIAIMAEREGLRSAHIRQFGLADARSRRGEARELVAAGKDPSIEKRRERIRAQYQASVIFSGVAPEYCEKRKRDGGRAWSPATIKRSEYLLSLLRGSIGTMPITDIEAVDVLAAVRRSGHAGQEATRKARC